MLLLRWGCLVVMVQEFLGDFYRNMVQNNQCTMCYRCINNCPKQTMTLLGKIRKGEEETYAMLLLPMEGNVLKIHREFPESNSRRLREAIGLALFDVKETYSGEKYDAGNFRNAENERLEKALLMAFDPYTNNEIMELLKDQFQVDMLSQEQKKKYYKFPIMCLLRIKESIDTWEKHSGSNGYFDFIEEYMGREIKGNDMNFSIMSSDIFDM